MILGNLIVPFAMSAFFYLILALQICGGFPAFYKRFQGSVEDEIKPILPFVFALMAILIASTVIPELFAVFGVVSAWCAVRVRRSVRDRANGPPLWQTNSLTIRWPMLVFDVWTLGGAMMVGLVIVSSSQ